MGRWDEGMLERIGVCCVKVLKHQAEPHGGIQLMHVHQKLKQKNM